MEKFADRWRGPVPGPGCSSNALPFPVQNKCGRNAQNPVGLSNQTFPIHQDREGNARFPAEGFNPPNGFSKINGEYFEPFISERSV